MIYPFFPFFLLEELANSVNSLLLFLLLQRRRPPPPSPPPPLAVLYSPGFLLDPSWLLPDLLFRPLYSWVGMPL